MKALQIHPVETAADWAELARLLQRARQAGYTHAGLSTWRSNLQGQALYARLGFQPVPPFKEHPNPDLLFLGLALPDH